MSRDHWKQDIDFINFNDRMLNEKFTFEQCLKLSTFDKLPFSDKPNWETIKSEWKQLVEEWNRIRGVKQEPTSKALGFVGLVYLMVVFPYKQLSDASVFCQHEVEIFNRAYFYVQNKPYCALPFQDLEELFDSGPIYPPAYSRWLDDLYNKASWWITYIVYERKRVGLMFLDQKRKLNLFKIDFIILFVNVLSC